MNPRPTSKLLPALSLACAILLALGTRGAVAQEKIPVKTLDDLPRHTYKITGSASELLQSDEQSDALIRQVQADVEADLEKYEIEDATTLKRLYGVLASVHMLAQRYDETLDYLGRVQKLEDKEAARLLSGVTTRALIAARRQAGDDDQKFRTLFKQTLLSKLRAMPWSIVGDDLESRKGSAEMITEKLVMGAVMATLDPVVANMNGEISADIAHGLVSRRNLLINILPLKSELIEVYSAVVAEHRVEKKDIWAARDVELSPKDKLKPIVIAIWDSGVDTTIFKGQLWKNPDERPDGQDNDGNGFVDDLHGIAYDLYSHPVPELLHPLDDMNADPGEVTKHMKGFMDVQAAIDSPEASAVKRKLGGLEPEDFKAFIEDLGLFGNYAHGTHVAGIAAAGNPFARLMGARITFDFHVIPKCPTIEDAQRVAKAQRDTVAYFKQHRVRVVNMSWGESRSFIEGALEQNGVGETAEERAELSRKIFKIMRDSLYEAIKGAPDILFVTSAGNADNDVEFDEMIPSGFDLPNLLVVGAVDQAGDPTDFTSFGRTVSIYASGFEVDSYIPGGKRMKFSGTSMSSPNVVNLVGKILAVKPVLTPTAVIELIMKGSDLRAGENPLRLINPQRTIELAKK